MQQGRYASFRHGYLPVSAVGQAAAEACSSGEDQAWGVSRDDHQIRIADMSEAKRLFRAYWKDMLEVAGKRDRLIEQWQVLRAKNPYAKIPRPELPPYPDFPEECRDMRCGAKSKRTGLPCRQKTLYPNGRCHFHGGPSTGPITPEGKRRSAANGLRPKRRKKEN